MCSQVVPNTDLVVGDVLLVNMGDKVVADGIMIDGFHLVVDEASLTGEQSAAALCFSAVCRVCMCTAVAAQCQRYCRRQQAYRLAAVVDGQQTGMSDHPLAGTCC
jgi:P-type E1-E2 ATPase